MSAEMSHHLATGQVRPSLRRPRTTAMAAAARPYSPIAARCVLMCHTSARIHLSPLLSGASRALTARSLPLRPWHDDMLDARLHGRDVRRRRFSRPRWQRHRLIHPRAGNRERGYGVAGQSVWIDAAVAFFDALRVKIRQDGVLYNKAVNLALAYRRTLESMSKNLTRLSDRIAVV